MALESDFESVDWVVVDVETTGLYPETGDRICEIGAIKFTRTPHEGITQFQSLINPERPIPAEITGINGIHGGMLADAPVARTVLPEFCAFVGDSVLAAYNARFDMSFIQMELHRAGLPLLTIPVVDVLWMARRLLPGLKSFKLAHVAQALGVTDHAAHRALGDVKATGHLLKDFLPKLQKQGIATIGDLLRRQRR